MRYSDIVESIIDFEAFRKRDINHEFFRSAMMGKDNPELMRIFGDIAEDAKSNAHRSLLNQFQVDINGYGHPFLDAYGVRADYRGTDWYAEIPTEYGVPRIWPHSRPRYNGPQFLHKVSISYKETANSSRGPASIWYFETPSGWKPSVADVLYRHKVDGDLEQFVRDIKNKLADAGEKLVRDRRSSMHVVRED